MFTGIVQTRGRVASIQPNTFGQRLVIDRSAWDPSIHKPSPGDSVCVSGVCLTVVTCDARAVSFDVIAETLAKSKLGSMRVGDEVNLEGSLTLSTPLGGHFMQGHVDGVGTVAHVRDSSDEWRITVTPPAGLMDYIVSKGSIAIDGVSLTVASVTDATFDVALIPTTLAVTTLGKLRASDVVNLEADVLAKTVVNYLKRIGYTGSAAGATTQGVTMQALRDAGFGR